MLHSDTSCCFLSDSGKHKRLWIGRETRLRSSGGSEELDLSDALWWACRSAPVALRLRSQRALETSPCLVIFRGAVFGALQSDRSRRHSGCLPARVRTGSTKSDADDTAVPEKLHRWRNQVRIKAGRLSTQSVSLLFDLCRDPCSFQFIRGGGRCLFFLLRHSYSLSLHVCSYTQTTGEKTVKLVKQQSFRWLLSANFHSCASPGLSRVWFPSSCAALGDRSVPVLWSAVTGFLRSSERRRYSIPVPDLCQTSSHYTAAVPAGPGELPDGFGAAPRKQPHLPGLEGLQHTALKTSPQQPGWVQ